MRPKIQKYRAWVPSLFQVADSLIFHLPGLREPPYIHTMLRQIQRKLRDMNALQKQCKNVLYKHNERSSRQIKCRPRM